jgi:hypothetical protein
MRYMAMIPVLVLAAAPGLSGGGPFAVSGAVITPLTCPSVRDTLDRDPIEIMMGGLTRSNGESRHSLPLGLDRLLPVADCISDFEIPGGIRIRVGLDGIGLGIEF